MTDAQMLELADWKLDRWAAERCRDGETVEVFSARMVAGTGRRWADITRVGRWEPVNA